MKTLETWLAEPTVEIVAMACDGCGRRLLPGEPCAICAAFARMRDRLYRRRRAGAFLALSQPKEKDA